MASISFQVNGKPQSVEVDPDTPLLWVLRDNLSLTGTKYGCGIGQCGACTVHLEGNPTRSCSIAISDVAGKSVTTIEGLSPDRGQPIQLAWIAEQVPQCGYCQSGQVMAAAALLAKNPKPTDAQIDRAMSGNICRCGTYQRIRRAIHRAAGQLGTESAASSPADAPAASQVLHLEDSDAAPPDHCDACFVSSPAQGGAR
jgi:isoquinoline 1-oxidoreductase subunit alpha